MKVPVDNPRVYGTAQAGISERCAPRLTECVDLGGRFDPRHVTDGFASAFAAGAVDEIMLEVEGRTAGHL